VSDHYYFAYLPLSNITIVNYDVQQGSVLGSLMFPLYMLLLGDTVYYSKHTISFLHC